LIPLVGRVAVSRQELPVGRWLAELAAGQEFIGMTGFHEPVNGGIWVVKPSHSALEQMLKAIDNGFHPVLGWSSLGSRIIPWSTSAAHCRFFGENNNPKQLERCTAGQSITWEGIPYAETDQGLHYHVFNDLPGTLTLVGNHSAIHVNPKIPPSDWFPIVHYIAAKPWRYGPNASLDGTGKLPSDYCGANLDAISNCTGQSSQFADYCLNGFHAANGMFVPPVCAGGSW